MVDMLKTDKAKSRVLNALKRIGALNKCGACDSSKFDIADYAGFIDLNPVPASGMHIPAAIVVCENCGHIRLHALSALGLSDLGKPEGWKERLE